MLAKIYGFNTDALWTAWAVYREMLKVFENRSVPFRELVLHFNAGDFKSTAEDRGAPEGVLLKESAGGLVTIRVIVNGCFDDCQEAKSTMRGWSAVFPLLRSRQMVVVEFYSKGDRYSY